jgi:hypothetical protein
MPVILWKAAKTLANPGSWKGNKTREHGTAMMPPFVLANTVLRATRCLRRKLNSGAIPGGSVPKNYAFVGESGPDETFVIARHRASHHYFDCTFHALKGARRVFKSTAFGWANSMLCPWVSGPHPGSTAPSES